VLERREQFQTLRLNENLDALNPAIARFFQQGQEFFLGHTGDLSLSRQMTLQTLENARNQQALSLAYFDVFWCSAAVAAALVFLVLLMRRSVAEKGAHITAE
jgi:DHA2 family multidrug resistance protein